MNNNFHLNLNILNSHILPNTYSVCFKCHHGVFLFLIFMKKHFSIVSLLGATEVAWYKGDEVIKETFDDFKFDHEGELHRLTIAEVFPEDSGVYKAEGSNATGANSSQFTILVNGELVTTITVLSCSMNTSSGVLLIIDTRCQLVNDAHARLSISTQPDFHKCRGKNPNN